MTSKCEHIVSLFLVPRPSDLVGLCAQFRGCTNKESSGPGQKFVRMTNG